jgi:hypothetical protein
MLFDKKREARGGERSIQDFRHEKARCGGYIAAGFIAL